jgi:predicted amidohydrolase
MRQLAGRHNCLVIGSYIIKEKGFFYNRLHAVTGEGLLDYYDKRHLFSFAGENKHYQAGSRRPIVTWRGWNILPSICYDLRFPVWHRSKNAEYEVLINIANWPEVRILAWDQLLAARAIENSAYAVGVNRYGKDPNVEYNGHSSVYNPKGECETMLEKGNEVKTITLSGKWLEQYRDKFDVFADADDFNLGEVSE